MKQEMKATSAHRRIAVSPMFVTGAAGTIVLLLLLGGGYLRRAFVERLNPRITIDERSAADRIRSTRNERDARTSNVIFDGEVYRTETRLREASALAIATSLYGIRTIAERRPVTSVNALIAGVAERNLTPPGLAVVPNEAAFASAHATLYVRFRPQPFGVEILSISRERTDGASLLVRVPDREDAERSSAERQLHFYQAMRLGDVRVPPPFALPSEIQAHGWTIETMRASLPADADPQQLTVWLRELNAGR